MSQSTGYVRHFIACNQCDDARFAPLFIGGDLYGYILRNLTGKFLQTGLFKRHGDGIALTADFDNFKSRSEALMKITRMLCEHYGKPLREEAYALTRQWDEAPIAQIDRVAVPWFGVRAWGVHVNGFARKADGIYLWVGKRAANRPAEAGKLDNLIGGGMPLGLSIEENLCKEAQEEAGIGRTLALTARYQGEINYKLEWQEGLRRDTLFIYDLELPENFTPQNMDGEVESFKLMPAGEVAALVRDTDQFKFNCSLVIIDFLMRHEFITPQEGEYVKLQAWLGQ